MELNSPESLLSAPTAELFFLCFRKGVVAINLNLSLFVGCLGTRRLYGSIRASLFLCLFSSWGLLPKHGLQKNRRSFSIYLVIIFDLISCFPLFFSLCFPLRNNDGNALLLLLSVQLIPFLPLSFPVLIFFFFPLHTMTSAFQLTHLETATFPVSFWLDCVSQTHTAEPFLNKMFA